MHTRPPSYAGWPHRPHVLGRATSSGGGQDLTSHSKRMIPGALCVSSDTSGRGAQARGVLPHSTGRFSSRARPSHGWPHATRLRPPGRLALLPPVLLAPDPRGRDAPRRPDGCCSPPVGHALPEGGLPRPPPLCAATLADGIPPSSRCLPINQRASFCSPRHHPGRSVTGSPCLSAPAKGLERGFKRMQRIGTGLRERHAIELGKVSNSTFAIFRPGESRSSRGLQLGRWSGVR